jgi:hypothetical protein
MTREGKIVVSLIVAGKSGCPPAPLGTALGLSGVCLTLIRSGLRNLTRCGRRKKQVRVGMIGMTLTRALLFGAVLGGFHVPRPLLGLVRLR